MKLLKCPVCGNIVEMVEDHHVPVMCCGQMMVELKANTTDGALEKHVPVASFENGVLHVEVGSVEHPSLPEHYITMIIVKAGAKTLRADLKAGEKPAADFALANYHGVVEVYEYCNLHGLWKTEIEI